MYVPLAGFIHFDHFTTLVGILAIPTHAQVWIPTSVAPTCVYNLIRSTREQTTMKKC